MSSRNNRATSGCSPHSGSIAGDTHSARPDRHGLAQTEGAPNAACDRVVRPNSVLVARHQDGLAPQVASNRRTGDRRPRPSDRKLPAQDPLLHLQCWGESAVFLQNPCSGHICGAGGNRTPVHRAMNVRDTAIPDSLANAARPAGRLTVASGGPRSVFAECQQTFLQSAVFLAVIPRFCCRAAVDRPRAPFLVTMSLRSPKN